MKGQLVKNIITAGGLMKLSVLSMSPISDSSTKFAVLVKSTGFLEGAYTLITVEQFSALPLFRILSEKRYPDAQGMLEAVTKYYELTGTKVPQSIIEHIEQNLPI